MPLNTPPPPPSLILSFTMFLHSEQGSVYILHFIFCTLVYIFTLYFCKYCYLPFFCLPVYCFAAAAATVTAILFETYFESPWITLTTSQGNSSWESKFQAHVTQTICTHNMMTIHSACVCVDVHISIVHCYTHQYLHWINSHTATVSVSQRKPHSSLNQEVESVSQHPFCVTEEVGQTLLFDRRLWQMHSD